MTQIEEGYSLERHVEGEPRRLDTPVRHLEFGSELEELRRGRVWDLSGHNAKTLVKYEDLRVVLIALKEGTKLDQHHTIGRLTIQILEGKVRLRLPTEVLEIARGALVALGRSVMHDLEALEESVVLLTIAWPSAGAAD